MSLPSVDEFVAVYNQVRASDVARAEQRLFQNHGIEAVVPQLVRSYPRVRRGHGRASILFWLPRFARSHPQVVELAVAALQDPTCQVRSEACAILAYSLREDTLPSLAPLLAHTHPKTRADAAAAMDAISHRNHHFYVDRAHTGSTFWGVGPVDFPAGASVHSHAPALLPAPA